MTANQSTTRSELLSRRTREAVRDTMSDTVLREIDEMWQDELFAPPAEDRPAIGGQRVTHFQGYLDQVDWTDPAHVARALRVFEVALRPLFNPPEGFRYGTDVVIPRLQRLFQRDGYELGDQAKITGGPAIIAPQFLADLPDAAVIHEHLNRMSAPIERDDPAQAIGSAKELIESTAKLVLRERGQTYSDAEDLPALAMRAQQSLAVHPAGRPTGPDGSDAVKKILGAVTTTSAGIAELRNRGYGTGHGQGDVPERGVTVRA